MLRFSPARGAASIVLNSNVRGPQGPAATVTVGSTTTRAAGLAASVINAGTESAAILNFLIPRGADAGICFSFETSTSMAAPASGGIRLNNATLSSVTAIAVNAADAGAVDVSDFVATWDDSTNATKGYIEVRKEGSGAVEAIYQITSVTDNTTWLQLAVTYVSGSGAFTVDDHVYLTPLRTGNKGGNAGISWAFESSTTMAIPATGALRLNNASFASVTAAAINVLCGESGNPTVRTWLQAFDDSTTTAHRGYVLFRNELSPQNFAIYDITGALTDNTTWVQLALTYVTGSGSFSAADTVVVTFVRTGDKGSDGAGTLSGSTGATDNAVIRADGVGGNTVQNSTVVIDDSGNVTGVATLTTTGSIELANASDTTLSRSGAGRLAVEGKNALLKGQTDDLSAAGYTSTSVSAGTKSSGTYTFDPTAGSVQHYTNGGAHTLAPPTGHGAWMLDVTNNASAGAITTSGWTKVNGDAFDTTNAHTFRCSISVGNIGSLLNVTRIA